MYNKYRMMQHSDLPLSFHALIIAVCYCCYCCHTNNHNHNEQYAAVTGFMLQQQARSTSTLIIQQQQQQQQQQRTQQHLFLFVDPSYGESVGGGEGGGGGPSNHHRTMETNALIKYSQAMLESCQKNEWGIPASSTLEPFGPTPQAQLPNGGRITLVGSGPGDPELLTMKAYKLLTAGGDDTDTTNNNNTLVIADRLVSDEILDVIRTEAPHTDIKVARKFRGCAEFAQEEIYFWTYAGLAQGKHVIRLKIGDPYVFGRGGEEVLQFRKFGVEATIVPGVSAAFSAPLLGNIPVTHRGVSNQVVMCTGYGREGTSPDLIQYHEEQTIVFLMAVGRLRTLADRLVTMAGYPSETPVGIIERAGCPNQRTVVGTIATIADIAEQHNVQAPSTIVVGKVVNVLLEKDEDGVISTVDGLIQTATSATSATPTTEVIM